MDGTTTNPNNKKRNMKRKIPEDRKKHTTRGLNVHIHIRATAQPHSASTPTSHIYTHDPHPHPPCMHHPHSDHPTIPWHPTYRPTQYLSTRVPVCPTSSNRKFPPPSGIWDHAASSTRPSPTPATFPASSPTFPDSALVLGTMYFCSSMLQ